MGTATSSQKSTTTKESAKDSKHTKANETIRVRAIAVGYYDDIRRRVGDVFDLVPRTGTFTQLVKDKDGRPEINREALVPHRITEEVDDVTLTAEQQFSKRWMVKVSKDTPERASTAQERIQAEHDLILRNRLGGPTNPAAEQVSTHGTAPGDGGTGDEHVI